LKPQFCPASLVSSVLAARLAKASCDAARSPGARSSYLQVGQSVRTRIERKWLPGIVQMVCKEPESYLVRLSDGRSFRWTCWAINVDRHAGALITSSGGPSGHTVSFGPAVAPPSRPVAPPSSSVPGMHATPPSVAALSESGAAPPVVPPLMFVGQPWSVLQLLCWFVLRLLWVVRAICPHLTYELQSVCLLTDRLFHLVCPRRRWWPSLGRSGPLAQASSLASITIPVYYFGVPICIPFFSVLLSLCLLSLMCRSY
jgi:hypothetical protein